ncbi:MAG TPA: Holliday junction resolvase RuvX [Alphaproteobacteria bacterium]
MGIDQGTKTLGLSLSDPDQLVVTPLKTIQRTKLDADAKALQIIIKDYGVGGLIIGWPVNMDGTQGARAQSVKDYLQVLIPKLDNIWHAVWDERLTSDVAHRKMADDMDLSFHKRKTAVDALAAQTILEDALHFMARKKE